MVENRPLVTFLTHLVLVLGVLAIALPVWITFVASTHDQLRMNQAPLPLWPGNYFLENMKQTLFGSGLSGTETAPVWLMLLNSLAMAMMISLGKIAISLLSAFAIVYFKFPGKMVFFWLIFLTLMLPVEVRIVPTYEVIAGFGMLNSYGGLILPLIASATASCCSTSPASSFARSSEISASFAAAAFCSSPLTSLRASFTAASFSSSASWSRRSTSSSNSWLRTCFSSSA